MLTNLTTDRSALVALYNATSGDQWWHVLMGTGWLSNKSVCDWDGQAVVAPAVPHFRLERLLAGLAAHVLEAGRILGAHQR